MPDPELRFPGRVATGSAVLFLSRILGEDVEGGYPSLLSCIAMINDKSVNDSTKIISSVGR